LRQVGYGRSGYVNSRKYRRIWNRIIGYLERSLTDEVRVSEAIGQRKSGTSELISIIIELYRYVVADRRTNDSWIIGK